MPALARARGQAKVVICQSNLKQWATFFTMYTDDNNTSFMEGRGCNDWWAALEPYYKDRALLCCPMAADPDKYPWEGYGNFGTWGPDWFPDGFYGSYGINEWLCNPVSGCDGFDYMPSYYWRNTQVANSDQIPMLFGAWWDQAWAEYYDWIPDYPGQFEGVGFDDMAHFCINRHNGGINGVFLDSSVRKVFIKELWNLRWHRKYDITKPPPNWPDWVEDLN